MDTRVSKRSSRKRRTRGGKPVKSYKAFKGQVHRWKQQRVQIASMVLVKWIRENDETRGVTHKETAKRKRDKRLLHSAHQPMTRSLRHELDLDIKEISQELPSNYKQQRNSKRRSRDSSIAPPATPTVTSPPTSTPSTPAPTPSAPAPATPATPAPSIDAEPPASNITFTPIQSSSSSSSGSSIINPVKPSISSSSSSASSSSSLPIQQQ